MSAEDIYPGVKVQLTLSELLYAAAVGAQRHHESVISGRRDQHGLTKDESGLGLHVEGAAGEIAAARALGLYFSGHVNSFKEADLGDRVQVRTRSKAYYDLIVRKDDSDDHTFVLVTGLAPNFRVRGWLLGKDAKKSEFLKTYGDRKAAWFVPAQSLNSIESFFE